MSIILLLLILVGAGAAIVLVPMPQGIKYLIIGVCVVVTLIVLLQWCGYIGGPTIDRPIVVR